jgi:hypothetical protein
MKIAPLLLLATALAGIALIECQNFVIRPAFSYESYSTEVIPVTTGKDLLVFVEKTSPDLLATTITRRNSSGHYERVANSSLSSDYVTTNGRWVGFSRTQSLATVFVDQNNSVSQSYDFNLTNSYFLSDDTIVGSINVDNFFLKIVTLEFNSDEGAWQEIPGTELTLETRIFRDLTTFRVTDSHMVIMMLFAAVGNSRVDIYKRNADKSWKLIEMVRISTMIPGTIAYNLVDTIVYGVRPNFDTDTVLLYTKINNKWIEQSFRSTNLGLKANCGFGSDSLFIDADTLIIAAPWDNFVPPATTYSNYQGGKVLLFLRNKTTGLWEHALHLVAETGLFGGGLGINDHDVIITSMIKATENSSSIISFSVIPICPFHEPINVTCHDQEVNTCMTDFSSIDVLAMEVYTINNECGQVTANVTRVNVVSDNKLEAQLSFSRAVGQRASCQVTVTCPNAPKSQTNTPAASSAAVIQLGLVSLFGLASLLF